MKTLDSFMKKVEPKRRVSKLKKFENEIFELYDNGYRVSQIKDFLFENGINIQKRRIWDFIANRDKVVVETTEIKTDDGKTIKTTRSKALESFLNKIDGE